MNCLLVYTITNRNGSVDTWSDILENCNDLFICFKRLRDPLAIGKRRDA